MHDQEKLGQTACCRLPGGTRGSEGTPGIHVGCLWTTGDWLWGRATFGIGRIRKCAGGTKTQFDALERVAFAT